MVLTDRESKTLQLSFIKMTSLEERKHIQPKFSDALRNLQHTLNLGTIEPSSTILEEDKEDMMFSVAEGGESISFS